MRALVLRDGRATVESVARPVPADDETLVEVRCVGVCATDLALAKGYMGFAGVPGHEFVGVARGGPLDGRRVVGEINAGCGTCARCRAGDPRHCEARTVLGIFRRPGAFAEALALPTRNLLAVPDDVPDEAAVFTEPLAAALQIPSQVAIVPGAPALVAGDGRLGILCAHALAEAGAEVTLAGRHPERASLLPAGARLVTGLLESDAPPPAERVYGLAVEATGRADVLPRLLPHVRPGGTIVLKTTTERPVTLDLAPLVVDEITLLGSRCGRFAPALALLASGRVPWSAMVADRFPLEQAPRALQRAAEPGVLKVLVDVR
ncbi:MAG: alcohol dehydrogenase catalytic domain-containing protein [Planctomycetes bacterium]|nr:alcohol dehydrogenase catalytic domain-containing protein [Planctomycetota bacterium]